jgi:hypothetical protein
MDCDKLASVLMDELYGELDDVTSAAVKRHVAGCARCAALLNGFRATRRLATLPMADVPAGLEERILAGAAAHGPRGAALQWRVSRVVSLAGNWAMRPQTAMAAVFMVMIGTSVLLLRGRSSRAPASAEMIVTEEGTPAPAASATAVDSKKSSSFATAASKGSEAEQADRGSTFAAPAPAAAPVAASPAPVAAAPVAMEPAPETRTKAAAAKPAPRAADDGFADSPMPQPSRGLSALSSGAGAGPAIAAAPAGAHARLAEAPAQVGASSFDADSELGKARAERDEAVRRGLPCPSVARFNEVVNRASGTPAGWAAVYEGALCYESTGDYASARNRLNVLLRVDPYKDRARAQLDLLSRKQQPAAAPAGEATDSKPAAAAPPPATP